MISFVTVIALTLTTINGLEIPEVNWKKDCPCETPELCLPVKRTPTNEVFAFSPQHNDNWKYYDYNILTTIAWNTNKEMLCLARKNKVKVVLLKNFDDVQYLCNSSKRKLWIQEAYKEIVNNFLDGINIDTEKPLQGVKAHCLTLLLKELRAELKSHAWTKYAQITYDIPWKPSADRRYFDWKGLATYTDFLVVMAYDMRSQIFYQCIAGTNSPKALVVQGLDEFLIEYNLNPRKLVLALPWYGYRYECLYNIGEFCGIKVQSFEGAPCSDAAGSQIEYNQIASWLENTTLQVERQWDDIGESPWFYMKENGKTYQVRYDDPQSLALKYNIATQKNLLGVGMWNVDLLDYSGKDKPVLSTQQMWNTLKDYRNHNKLFFPIQDKSSKM